MGDVYFDSMAFSRPSGCSLLVAAILVEVATAQTCDSNLDNWPNTNRPNYCCPYAGDGTAATNSSRKCRKIEAQSTTGYVGNITAPNPCYWTNIAGQTPDTVNVWNSNFKNYFTTVGSYSKPSSTNTEHNLPSGADYAPAYYAQVRDPDGYTNNAPATYQYGFAECQVAQGYYNSFNSALNRYNCEEQYSHWNCDDCRKAYARWAAAMALPACALSSSDTAGGASCTAIKPCIRICNEVVQKCPVTLGFTCPGDSRDYSVDDPYCTTLNEAETTSPLTVQDPTTSVDYSATAAQTTVAYTSSCCNPMGLQNSASSASLSMLVAMICATLVGLFTL